MVSGRLLGAVHEAGAEALDLLVGGHGAECDLAQRLQGKSARVPARAVRQGAGRGCNTPPAAPHARRRLARPALPGTHPGGPWVA
jgi:hypothetical protein